MNVKTIVGVITITVLTIHGVTVCVADLAAAASPSGKMLMIDAFGRAVEVPTNEVPQDLQPPADIGLKRQTPNPIEGVNLPDAVVRRMQEGREGAKGFQFFPPYQPELMPYLAGFNNHGNSALRPGALTSYVPLDVPIQGVKFALSAYGLRYSLEQTATYVSMSDVKKGDDDTLAFYTFDLKAKWAIFDAPAAGTAGWISSQMDGKTGVGSAVGLGTAGDKQDAKSNIGSYTDPTGIWSMKQGVRVPELAWQESFCNGKAVVLAGVVSQRNYLDGNAFAHIGRGEFLNSALIHSDVLPLAQYNFGVNLQLQPVNEWYAMCGASAGNAPAGSVPWTDFSWSNWSLVGEVGYAPQDFLGLGPGVYRVQPFVAEKDGPTQPGLCFNIQQQLGLTSPFAWFGRFGFGGSEASASASAEIGTGFVMHAPLRYLGLVPRLNNDLLGSGFVWGEPAATTKTVYHENEYVLDTFYTLQLTPTVRVQPDVQVVWNPSFNRDAGPATVVQVQLILAW